MKKLITLTLLVTLQAHAGMELIKLKSSSSKLVTIPDAEVERVWASNSPACIKDGGSVLYVNRAFDRASLKSRDCSEGDGTVKKHKALGFSVTVIKIAELSDAKIRAILGK